MDESDPLRSASTPKRAVGVPGDRTEDSAALLPLRSEECDVERPLTIEIQRDLVELASREVVDFRGGDPGWKSS